MFYSLLLQCAFYFKLKIWKTMIIDSLQISAPSPSKVALLYPPFDPGTNFGIILQCMVILTRSFRFSPLHHTTRLDRSGRKDNNYN